MASVRLNKTNRKKILENLLEYRFGKEARKLVDRYKKLAHEVYVDVHTKAVVNQMEKMPKGWLGTSNRIEVKLAMDYHSFYFNGSNWLPYQIRFLRGEYYSKDLRMLEKHRARCAKIYDASHPLTVKFQKLHAEKMNLQETVIEATKTTEAALESVTTMNALIKSWPAVEPFVTPFNNLEGRPALPVLTTEKLNELLNLPYKGA